ncbi:MAG: carboxypeptidase regulatory-like domain-containing protein [Bifidobacteriaceae bacterium]|jgi:protocatechuate 3,4-dioxygenase beta subunit|nr:carboxypeptidase regulatory-like domain-containing protein [Bifidobacteriaceae bacterium]
MSHLIRPPHITASRRRPRARRACAIIAAIATAGAFGAALAPAATAAPRPAAPVLTSVVTPAPSLSGIVTDAVTHAPIPDAYVYLYDLGEGDFSCDGGDDGFCGTMTDANGAYSFAGIRTDSTTEHYLLVTHSGYQSFTYASGATFNFSQGSLTRNIALSPNVPEALTISGTLTDATTSSPIANASINLIPADATSQGWDSTNTDENGHFTMQNLSAAAGNFKLYVSASGYATYTTDPFELRDQNVTLDIALPPNVPASLTISGTVTDAATSQPIEDADVMLFHENAADDGTWEDDAWTDSNGSFTMTDLFIAQGSYYLSVDAYGYADAVTAPFTLTTSNLELNIALTPLPALPYSIHGTVTDATTNGPADWDNTNLKLLLLPAESDDPLADTWPDRDGTYAFDAGDVLAAGTSPTGPFRLRAYDDFDMYLTATTSPFTISADTVKNMTVQRNPDADWTGHDSGAGAGTGEGSKTGGSGGGAVAPPSTATLVKAAIGQVRLLKGHSYKLLASGYDQTGGPMAVTSYKSSAPKVATVTQAGKVKALKPGKATITIASGATATTKVTVTVVKKKPAKAKVKKIKLTGLPKGGKLTAGTFYPVGVKVTPATALGVTPAYSVKGAGASIDKYGFLKAPTKGKATLKVKAGGKTTKLKLTIK